MPVPLIDFMTGMYAAQSVLAALWQAERTGTGAHLDCALLDSAATLTSTVALFSLSGEFEPSRIGTESYLRVPSAVFAAADGEHVQVIALHERHWEALCAALDKRDWLDDQRFAGNDARLANRELRQRVDRRGDRHGSRRRMGRAHQRSGRHVRAASQPGRCVARPGARRARTRGRARRRPVRLPAAGRVTRAPRRLAGPGPRLGEHTDRGARREL